MADIEGALADLGRNVAVADMPGDLHQPHGIVRGDLDQPLRRGLDPDQPPVFQLHCVAVVEHRGAVEIEQEFQPALCLEGDAPPVAGFVVEGQGVGDALGLHGGAAKDGSGAEHRLGFPVVAGRGSAAAPSPGL